MSTNKVVVRPGQGLVARYGGGLLVLLSGGTQEVGGQLMALVREVGEGNATPGRALARRIVGLLSQADPDAVPAFAALGAAEQGWAVILHGGVELTITRAAGAERLSGFDAATWVDRIVEPGFLLLDVQPVGGGAGEADPRFDLSGGVVPGAGVQIQGTADLAGGQPATQAAAPVAPAPLTPEGAPSPEVGPGAAAPAWQQPEPAPAWQQPAAQPEATPAWQQPEAAPAWQQPAVQPEAAPAWQQPAVQPEAAPAWQQPAAQPEAAPAWQPQPGAAPEAAPAWQQPGAQPDPGPAWQPQPTPEPAPGWQQQPGAWQPQPQPEAAPAWQPQPGAGPGWQPQQPEGTPAWQPAPQGTPDPAQQGWQQPGQQPWPQQGGEQAWPQEQPWQQPEQQQPQAWSAGPAPAPVEEPPTLIQRGAASEAAPPAEPQPVATVATAEVEEDVPFEYVQLTEVPASARREALPVLSGEQPKEEAVEDSDAPLVYGVLSPAGYFNHPDALYCAVTGVSMLQRTHVLVQRPRPPLGVVVADDGSTFTLDKNYVVGREPERDPGVVSKEARPLKLVDAERSLSRVHAEVRLIDWDVYVVDRGSANGTYVLPRDAQQWKRLVADTPEKIAPGTRIAFGKRVMTFETHHQINPRAAV